MQARAPRMRRRGPRVLETAWGRAGLGSGAGEPGTLGSAPAAAAAGASRVWTRKAAGALAPALLQGEKRGGKNFLPPGVDAPGLPGANVAVVVGAGSECDHPPPHPRRSSPSQLGPRACVPLQSHLPGAAQGPGRAGGQEEAPEGRTLEAATRPTLWGGARLCAAGSQVGVSAPSRPQIPHLGTGSLHSIPSNFRGRGT